MTWPNDGDALHFASDDLRLYSSQPLAHVLGKLPPHMGALRVLTFSFEIKTAASESFGHVIGQGVWLIGHSRFRWQAEWVKRAYPWINVATINAMHIKVITAAPDLLFIGSANLGRQGCARGGRLRRPWFPGQALVRLRNTSAEHAAHAAKPRGRRPLGDCDGWPADRVSLARRALRKLVAQRKTGHAVATRGARPSNI
jgi:hypothetical protein